MEDKEKVQPMREIIPLPKQHIAWGYFRDDITTDILYGGAAGGGKSYWLCQVAVVTCYELPGASFGLARKELTTLMRTTYVSLMEVLNDLNIPKDDWTFNGKYNYLEFKNGSKIYMIDTAYKPTDPEYDRFGGFLLTHCGGEEIPEWNSKAYEVLKTRVGRNNKFEVGGKEVDVLGKFLGTANPNSNWVKSVYYDPVQKGDMPEYRKFVPALATDNHHLPASYIKNLEQTENKQLRERLLDGNWDYSEEDAGTLMTGDSLSDLFSNTIIDDNQRYMSVDVSRFGGDSTVINCWKGLDSYKRIYKQKQGIDETARDIRDIASAEGIPFSNIIVDEDGIGGGVKDILRGVKGFVANSTPFVTKPIRKQARLSLTTPGGKAYANFSNLKAQCGFKLAELVMDRKMRISDVNDDERGTIIQELSWVKQKNPDRETKLKLVPKDEIKEGIGRSPDVGDTFLMRAWFEVVRGSSTGMPLPGMNPVQMKPRRNLNKRGI